MHGPRGSGSVQKEAEGRGASMGASGYGGFLGQEFAAGSAAEQVRVGKDE